MRRPSALSYLLGNPVLFFALGVGAFAFTYRAIAGHDEALFAIAFWIVGIIAQRHYVRVQKYTAWQREWDAMAPPPPNPTRSNRS